jgi:DNA-binding transcriptional ArsR family regulator
MKMLPFKGRKKARITTASILLRAISNEVRLETMCYLLEREINVGELMTLTGVSQSALSQHLRILRMHNMVVTRRNGNNVFYSIAENQREMIEAVVSATVQGWEARK